MTPFRSTRSTCYSSLMSIDTLPAPTTDDQPAPAPLHIGSPSWGHRKAVQGGGPFAGLPVDEELVF